MIRFLVEGTSDISVLREVCTRGFGLVQGSDYQIFWHKGKGRLPSNPSLPPAPTDESLLGQLPAKLRGYGKSDPRSPVVVLVDADRDDCKQLKESLVQLLSVLADRPATVLFRIAVEEMESWLIADHNAVSAAYPHANMAILQGIPPDAVVGAWEMLARAIGRDPERCSGLDKVEWAENISPHLTISSPPSPSFFTLIKGLEKITGLNV